MCGIIAYIGTQQAKSILLDGLKRLEYRGYDSSGIAVMGKEKINYQKEVGKVSVLENFLSTIPLDGNVGIAHTRWATHGKPSAINAHPHYDCTGKIWVVHNGIIENYQTLKNVLIEKGHTFVSETDTEVLVHLIEHYKNDAGILLEEAVLKALSDIKGAYAIVVMSQDEPNKLVAAKFSSPLCLGLIKNGNFVIASDLSAVVTLTNEMITLDDAEMIVVTFGEYRIINTKNQNILSKKTETIDSGYDVLDKGEYAHYMEKEIFEQPNTLHQTLQGRVFLEEGRAVLGGIVSVEHQLRDIERIHIVACGTAACAGQIGELLFENISRISARVYCASEFRYRDIVSNHKKELIIAISQSGETADTLKVVEDAKQKGILTVGIVNTVGSTIARLTDAGVYCRVGPEIAVASTKAFTSQVALLFLLAVYMARQRYMNSAVGKTLLQELSKTPQYIEEVLKRAVEMETIAKKYVRYEHFAFMGRKYQFPVAFEGNIKLKEISYIHAEAFASGELKHGPIALIDENFPSLFLCLKDNLYDKNVSNIQEVKARGGKVIAIATDGDRDLCAIADDIFYIPKVSECLAPIVSVVPLQLFAYYVARERGCDIDKPRNLAKSVTVE